MSHKKIPRNLLHIIIMRGYFFREIIFHENFFVKIDLTKKLLLFAAVAYAIGVA